MLGDVTLSNKMVTVVVTAEDQQQDPEIISFYIDNGLSIVKDERPEKEEE